MGRRTDFFPGWPGEQAGPGDYCKVPPGVMPWHDRDGKVPWFVVAPDGSSCTLAENHGVMEHPDGTITVMPSIVTRTWHGWLTRGVWS